MHYIKLLFMFIPFLLGATFGSDSSPDHPPVSEEIPYEVSEEACYGACEKTFQDISQEVTEKACEGICEKAPPPPTPSTAVLLAQMCVAEVSFLTKDGKPDTLECELMVEINYRNAKRSGISVEQQTRRFNAYFKSPNKQRPWIQYLNAEGTEPLLWPSKAASWKVHKKYWEAYLKVAREYPRKSRRKWHRPLCIRADDYGGRCDDNGVHACDIPKQKCALKIRCLRDQTYQAYWNLECCRDPKQLKCN